MDVATARAFLLSRAELDARGLSSRAIAAAVEHGRLRRVHRGWFVERATWDAAYPEDRHLMHVVAVHAAQRGTDAVAALTSAAVLHRLPLFRLVPQRVHFAGRHLNGRVTSGDVARHEVDVPDADRTQVDGIACTSLARTVADMIRLAPREAGVAIADAALRAVAHRGAEDHYDVAAAEKLKAHITERLTRVRRARGIRRGRHLLDIADGRAHLPGESVSRLYLLDLGFAMPRLQVPLTAPGGGWYYVDFGLDDVDAWGEFDGIGKYLDPKVRGSATLEEAFLAEKAREDWIRGTTDRRFPRWGTPAIASAATLGERLASFHVRPPG